MGKEGQMLQQVKGTCVFEVFSGWRCLKSSFHLDSHSDGLSYLHFHDGFFAEQSGYCCIGDKKTTKSTVVLEQCS